MKRIVIPGFLLLISIVGFAQKEIRLKKKDRKRDVELVTSMGSIVVHLSDSTPLHRDNFLKLVKQGYYDSVLFHRVINNFMIQGGDPDSKHCNDTLLLGNGDVGYWIPAEFNSKLYHKK